MSQVTLQSVVKLSSGYSMPLLGLGVYKNVGDSCRVACVAALTHGYRHIDSAIVYRNEEEVGGALREVEEKVTREEIFVTSKITSRYHGYDSTTKQVNESLKRFQFEYIDLFLIHDPLSGKKKRLETYQALLDAQKEGKIRSVGVSNFNVKHLEEIKEAGLTTPAVNQVELHPYCQQKEIVEYCKANDIVVQAYTPLVHGEIRDDAVGEVARKKRVSPFQVLIRWSLQHGFVPLPKSERPDRIASNADVYSFVLDDGDMKAIDALDQGKDGAVTWNPIFAD